MALYCEILRGGRIPPISTKVAVYRIKKRWTEQRREHPTSTLPGAFDSDHLTLRLVV